jgi:hypothetical protein
MAAPCAAAFAPPQRERGAGRLRGSSDRARRWRRACGCSFSDFDAHASLLAAPQLHPGAELRQRLCVSHSHCSPLRCC